MTAERAACHPCQPARCAGRRPPRAEPLPGGGGGWFGRAALHTVLIIVSLIWLLPTVSLFVSSLRPANEVLTTGWWNAFRLPFEFTLDNYQQVLTENNMAQSFVNSLLITIPATVIPILVAAFAAYAFAWMDFPGRNLAVHPRRRPAGIPSSPP